jgi:hypothetical protein
MENEYGKAVPGETPDQAARRRAEFYHQQRLTAEEQASEGDVRAQAETQRIYSKLGRQAPQVTDADAINKIALAVLPTAAALGVAGAGMALARARGVVGADGQGPAVGVGQRALGAGYQDLGQARPATGTSLAVRTAQRASGTRPQPVQGGDPIQQIEDAIFRGVKRALGSGKRAITGGKAEEKPSARASRSSRGKYESSSKKGPAPKHQARGKDATSEKTQRGGKHVAKDSKTEYRGKHEPKKAKKRQ